jgi:hypothetical protein
MKSPSTLRSNPIFFEPVALLIAGEPYDRGAEESSKVRKKNLDLQLVSVWASTSRDRPRRSSRPARHRAGRTGAGAGHGATHGGAPVAPDLRVSRGERRRQVEFRVPIDVGAGRPWLGGLRRWLPGFARGRGRVLRKAPGFRQSSKPRILDRLLFLPAFPSRGPWVSVEPVSVGPPSRWATAAGLRAIPCHLSP